MQFLDFPWKCLSTLSYSDMKNIIFATIKLIHHYHKTMYLAEYSPRISIQETHKIWSSVPLHLSLQHETAIDQTTEQHAAFYIVHNNFLVSDIYLVQKIEAPF